jgi:hypothetical protein
MKNRVIVFVGYGATRQKVVRYDLCSERSESLKSRIYVVDTQCMEIMRYSGPSSYDQLDIRTTWVTTKILILTYDQISSYDPHGVGKLQSEPRYTCLWM